MPSCALLSNLFDKSNKFDKRAQEDMARRAYASFNNKEAFPPVGKIFRFCEAGCLALLLFKRAQELKSFFYSKRA